MIKQYRKSAFSVQHEEELEYQKVTEIKKVEEKKKETPKSVEEKKEEKIEQPLTSKFQNKL
jgi:hypothetical protein